VVFVLRLAAPTIKHLRRGQVFDRFITTSVTVIVDQLQNLVFKKNPVYSRFAEEFYSSISDASVRSGLGLGMVGFTLCMCYHIFFQLLRVQFIDPGPLSLSKHFLCFTLT
jgi:hypothetical protein